MFYIKSEFDKPAAVENLKRVMKERGLTQKELARLLKVTPAAISKNMSPDNGSFFEYHRMVIIAKLVQQDITELFPVRARKVEYEQE